MGALTWLLRGCATLFLFAAAPAAAQGTVEGHLQLDGESVPITHVYAREGMPRAGSAEPAHVIILMTDRPAPSEVRASRQAYYAAAREGRIRGALLVLEPEPRFALFAPGGSYVDTSVPDVFDRLTLSGLSQEGGTVSGRLQMSEAGTLAFGAEDAPTTYRVDLSFTAPIAPGPRPTATLTGEAARGSPQAAAALRGLQVIRTGSVADVRAAVHPEAWNSMTDQDGQAMLQIARYLMPTPEAFLESIQQVVVYDDVAVISARGREGGTTIALRRDGNAWKLGPPPIPND